jgi:hypothetical protein
MGNYNSTLDTACRNTSLPDGPQQYDLTTAKSELDCLSLCENRSDCTGVEFQHSATSQDKRCEIWKVPMTQPAKVTGFTCYVKKLPNGGKCLINSSCESALCNNGICSTIAPASSSSAPASSSSAPASSSNNTSKNTLSDAVSRALANMSSSSAPASSSSAPASSSNNTSKNTLSDAVSRALANMSSSSAPASSSSSSAPASSSSSSAPASSSSAPASSSSSSAPASSSSSSAPKVVYRVDSELIDNTIGDPYSGYTSYIDKACRDFDRGNSDSNYILTSAETESDCLKLCDNNMECKGYEYNYSSPDLHKRCELWKIPWKAIDAKGFKCAFPNSILRSLNGDPTSAYASSSSAPASSSSSSAPASSSSSSAPASSSSSSAPASSSSSSAPASSSMAAASSSVTESIASMVDKVSELVSGQSNVNSSITKKGFSSVEIAGIVLGSLAGLVLFILFIYFIFFKRTKKSTFGKRRR